MTTPSNRRILVLDDNEAVRNDFVKILVRNAAERDLDSLEETLFGGLKVEPDRDFVVDVAGQGQEGLSMLEAAVARGEPYAMAFVDVRMPPGWNGIETTKRLWEVDPSLQIVISTAYSDYSWEQMVDELGSGDGWVILKKPFDPIEVRRLAGALCSKWDLWRENLEHVRSLEATVKERTERLEAVLAAVDVGILHLDPAGRVVLNNRSATRCLKRQEMVGQPLAALCTLWTHDELELPFETLLEHEVFDEPDGRIELPGGDSFPARLVSRRLRPGDRSSGLVFTLENTAAEKAAERVVREAVFEAEAARRAEAARGLFLANMSHELRTPLNVVIGYSEMLMDDLQLRDDCEHEVSDLQRIRNAGRHLLNIIDQILDLSKIDSGTMVVRRTEVDVEALLRPVQAEYAGECESKGVALQLAVRVGDPILTDGRMLQEIVRHLLSNAVKFTKSGRVDIVAELDGTELVVEVIDTGIGVPEETLELLFEAFTQADSSTTKAYGGAGLGLTLVRSFVGLLGGWVRVSSERDRGARFTIRLPLQDPEEPTEIWSVGEGDRVVLVVDADPATHGLVGRQLVRNGYRVVGAPTPALGLQQARILDPVLILLDVGSESGWRMLRDLRALPRTAAIPVVVLGGEVLDPGALAESTALAAMGKPVDRPRLLAILSRLEGDS